MNDYGRKLAIGTAGILLSTVTISYLVQKIFNHNYQDANGNSHRFEYPSLVTWMGCLFCSLYGITFAALWDPNPNQITFKQRFRLGALFTLNYLPTNYALLYISYPLQVIAKNSRYLLVVLVGVFFSRVKKNRELQLPKSKLLIAVVVTLGAGMFMYYDSRKASKENHFHPEKRWIGFLMLLLAITFDALFSDSQAYCKATFKPSQNQLFLASNLYGFLLIFLFALASGQLIPSLHYLLAHSQALRDMVMVASLQVVSQVSVYYVINNFKQHIYPLISTVRKLLTVLFSIFIFKHQMHIYQWLSVAIVFIAMGYEMYDQIKSKEQHRKVRRGRRESARNSRQSIPDNKDNHDKPPTHHNGMVSNGKKQDLQGRRNYHMAPANHQQTCNEESLSKYGYGWRKNQIAENRETSATPQKFKGV